MRCLLVIGLLVWASTAAAVGDATSLITEARALRDSGRLHQAVQRLQDALAVAPTASIAPQRQEAGLLLVDVLLQSNRLEEAEAQLTPLLSSAQGDARAALLLEQGRLALLRGQPSTAQSAFNEALATPATRWRAELNLAVLEAPPARRARLQRVAPFVAEPALLLNLAAQAQQLAETQLSHSTLRRLLAANSSTPRQRAQALQMLAALYEAEQRPAEALQLNRQALAQLNTLPEAQQADLRVLLLWQQGRLLPQESPAALAARQRAVGQLQLLRDDWPLLGPDGRSSFQTLFEPLYLELVDALLRRAVSTRAEAQQALLRQARDVVEQLRQAELQDYLGDRCEVDAVKGGSRTELPQGTVVVYPLLLNDRIELLLEDRQGLVALRSPATPQAVREDATDLARRLRDRLPAHVLVSQRLHAALLAPIDAWLQERGADTLVWVSDGVLRLVPMAALHDGKAYALQRYRMASSLGMSMTNTQATPTGPATALVAGAGRFGPVVEKLAQEAWAQPLRRQLLGGEAEAPAGISRSVQEARLRDALELPGVSQELAALESLLPSRALQDAGFTVTRFSSAVQAGGHRVVHIASHGVFGGSAASSYLLAYDDLLTLPGLTQLLQSDATRKQPIELLTLSACQTAEGNDRAPLGIAGAAMKARARAVLGTLWPVDDAATVLLMRQFYTGWSASGTGPSKAAALREAQLQLLQNADTRHPYFWAPFTLIGNWR